MGAGGALLAGGYPGGLWGLGRGTKKKKMKGKEERKGKREKERENERRRTKKRKDRKVNHNERGAIQGRDLRGCPPHAEIGHLTLCGHLRQKRMHQIVRIEVESFFFFFF